MAQNQLAALLRDFAQGASNSAASTVSAPVDGIAWLLRKAGVPIPAEPVGGSDWMARQGLTAQPTNALAGAVGEFAGGVAPIVAAAKATQIANRLLQMQANAAAPSTLRNASQRGIFMGDLSKTWDKDAAGRALAMEKAGADPRAIWQETGTFKGPDGKWRQEIDDSAMRVNYAALDDVPSLSLVGDLPRAHSIIEHKQLYDAYPQTSGLWVGKQKEPGGSYNNFSTRGGALKGHIALSTDRPTQLNSVAGHELQHAVQDLEGFAPGGSLNTPAIRDEVNRIYSEALPDFGGTPDQLMGMAQFNAYRRLAGEAEARAVQSRMNMTPAQRRATFPLDSYDVPVNSLIVR